MIICLCLLFAGRASAQWVVSDPGNLAQGIINASKNIIHTSKTATNMVSNFQETVKIYQQGKKYYGLTLESHKSKEMKELCKANSKSKSRYF